MAARKLVRLNHIHMAGIRARMALIEQKALELQTLRDGLTQFIEDQVGVNLRTEDWELDLDHAQLTRQAIRK